MRPTCKPLWSKFNYCVTYFQILWNKAQQRRKPSNKILYRKKRLYFDCWHVKEVKNWLSQLTLIAFHGFFQSIITPILFSANSTFSVMALYLKTKTRNSRKVLEWIGTGSDDSAYGAQLDHLILFVIYNTDYFSKLLIFHFNFFSNKKLAIGTSFAQVKIENRSS